MSSFDKAWRIIKEDEGKPMICKVCGFNYDTDGYAGGWSFCPITQTPDENCSPACDWEYGILQFWNDDLCEHCHDLAEKADSQTPASFDRLNEAHTAAAMRSAKIGNDTASFDDLMADRDQAIRDGKDLREHYRTFETEDRYE